MGFNGKHLSLEDRKIIENNINKELRKFVHLSAKILKRFLVWEETDL